MVQEFLHSRPLPSSNLAPLWKKERIPNLHEGSVSQTQSGLALGAVSWVAWGDQIRGLKLHRGVMR